MVEFTSTDVTDTSIITTTGPIQSISPVNSLVCDEFNTTNNPWHCFIHLFYQRKHGYVMLPLCVIGFLVDGLTVAVFLARRRIKTPTNQVCCEEQHSYLRLCIYRTEQ